MSREAGFILINSTLLNLYRETRQKIRNVHDERHFENRLKKIRDHMLHYLHSTQRIIQFTLRQFFSLSTIYFPRIFLHQMQKLRAELRNFFHEYGK
jgi:hypothetical protein